MKLVGRPYVIYSNIFVLYFCKKQNDSALAIFFLNFDTGSYTNRRNNEKRVSRKFLGKKKSKKCIMLCTSILLIDCHIHYILIWVLHNVDCSVINRSSKKEKNTSCSISAIIFCENSHSYNKYILSFHSAHLNVFQLFF